MTTLDKITSMWYVVDNGKLYIMVSRKGEVSYYPAPFDPYFFIKDGMQIAVDYIAKKHGINYRIEDTDLTDIEGNRLKKISTKYPYEVGTLAKLLKSGTFESDIPYERRVRLDLGWETADEYRTGYFDIEVQTKTNEYAKEGQLISIAIDSKDSSKIISGNNEEDILTEFTKTLKDYDLLVGYYSDKYDVPMLRNKLSKYGLQLPKTVRFADMYWMILGSTSRMFKSMKLDYIAQQLLGESRIFADKMIHELTPEQVDARCLRDAELLRLLNENYGYVDTAIAKAYISKLFPDETNSITRCIDSLVLQEARKLGYALPPRNYEQKGKHSGAFVLQPPVALTMFSNILVLDVTSMYPNIIIQYGISPDKDHVLYPNIVKMLLEERLKWKKIARTGDVKANIRQGALKVFLNAIYGSIGGVGTRLYSLELGDMIATKGREIALTLNQIATENGIRVIYQDTDSLFIQVNSAEEDVFLGFEEFFNDKIKERLGISISLEADKFFKNIFFPRKSSGNEPAKKRYAGMVTWEKGKGFIQPRLEIVGLEYVRSEMPELFKTVQAELINMYLSGKTKAELISYITNVKRELYSGKYDNQYLAYSKTLTKENYKVEPHHVKVAKMSAQNGVVYNVGDKVQYIYTIYGVRPVDSKDPVNYNHYWEHLTRIIERTLGINLQNGFTLDLY